MPTNWLQRLLSDEPQFTYAALAMLALSIPTIGLLLGDTRTFQGQSVWIKPLKFQISLALFFLTLALFARYLPQSLTARSSYQLYAGVVVACAVAEIIWICGAAAFATASHYNTGPIMSSIYGLMGLIAVVLTSATLVYGIAILSTKPSSPLVTAIGLSLVTTFVMTVVVAFRLAANEGHFIGEESLGATLPLFGWSTEVGDLRVPHFFATHAMQVVPFLVLLLQLFVPALLSHTTAIIVTGLYCALTIATFVQALGGRPLI